LRGFLSRTDKTKKLIDVGAGFLDKAPAVTYCGCAEARQEKTGTDKRKIFWNCVQEKTLTDIGEGFLG
jgi:hypothetical protein